MDFSTQFDSTSSQTEIERKYLAPDAETLSAVKELLLDKFGAEDLGCRDQVDTYYDTADSLLHQRSVTMRIREFDGEYVAAIKMPHASGASEGSMVRFERELVLPDGDLRYCRGLFVRQLPELEERFADLAVALLIKNSRNRLLVTCGETTLEVSLDTVSYHSGELSGGDYEVEIELKSGVSHTSNLGVFGRAIEEVFPQLKLTQQSKYERGMWSAAAMETEKQTGS